MRAVLGDVDLPPHPLVEVVGYLVAKLDLVPEGQFTTTLHQLGGEGNTTNIIMIHYHHQVQITIPQISW